MLLSPILVARLKWLRLR